MLVVLGLGSNKAFSSLESVEILARACIQLRPMFKSLTFSGIYRTKPMYVENQPDFFNMAVCGECELSSHELLFKIHEIESLFGRNRDLEIPKGQRSLDIDIELYGDEEIHYENKENPMCNLEIPHPRLHERAFVLIPMLEVLSVALKSDADKKRRDFYEKSLAKTGRDGVEKYLSSSDFTEMVLQTGASYGRTDSSSGGSSY